MIDRRCAVIVNFTANNYHWGCYGTSMEIYNSLYERGYYVNWLGVTDIHRLTPAPSTLEEFQSIDFAKRLFNANPTLYAALNDADVVVVNGEGTLHGRHNGSRNLLYIMHAARKILQKPVHLINHSCYPPNDADPSEPIALFYRGVILALNSVVARETISADILGKLGVSVHRGFDCLPRFIDRHAVAPYEAEHGPIILSGGAALSEAAAARIAAIVGRFVRPGQAVRFLSGAKRAATTEDTLHFSRMREAIPALEMAVARSMSEWLEEINRGACLVSGRFHHTLAAAMLDTPVVAFPSNTPKIAAVCDMLGLDAPIPYSY